MKYEDVPEVPAKGKRTAKDKFAKSYIGAGHKLLLWYSPWVSKNLFLKRPNPRPTDIWSYQRYDTEQAKKDARIEEIYLATDPSLHDAIVHSAVRDQVRYTP